MSDFYAKKYNSLVERGFVPQAVLDIFSCLTGSDIAKFHTAVELYSAFGKYEERDSVAAQVHEFTTTPNKSGTIAITGGAGATFKLEYEDEDGTVEEYDNQPTAVDGDSWDIQIVYATKKLIITQTGGAAAKICITY